MAATSLSTTDARAFLAALPRPEFDELVRSLERDRPRKRSRGHERQLELYKVRAYALRLYSERP
jgi:hypothetical protein